MMVIGFVIIPEHMCLFMKCLLLNFFHFLSVLHIEVFIFIYTNIFISIFFLTYRLSLSVKSVLINVLNLHFILLFYYLYNKDIRI